MSMQTSDAGSEKRTKKTTRGKRAPSGTRARSKAQKGGSAVASSAPYGSGTAPSSFVSYVMLDPNDGL